MLAKAKNIKSLCRRFEYSKNTIYPFSRIISPLFPILYSSKTRRKKKLSASTSDTLMDVKRTLAKPYPCRYNFQYREKERGRERDRSVRNSIFFCRVSNFHFFLLTLFFFSSHDSRSSFDFYPSNFRFLFFPLIIFILITDVFKTRTN